MSITKRNSLIAASVLVVASTGTSTILFHNHFSDSKASEKNQKSNKKTPLSMSVKTKISDLSKLDDYIVVDGDTPESLADHFQVNLNDFLQKYELSKSDQLIPGRTLIQQHDAIIASQSAKDSQNTADVSSAVPQSTAQTQQSSPGVTNSEPAQNEQTLTPNTQAVQPRTQTQSPQASAASPVAQTPTQPASAPEQNHDSDDPSKIPAGDLIHNGMGL